MQKANIPVTNYPLPGAAIADLRVVGKQEAIRFLLVCPSYAHNRQEAQLGFQLPRTGPLGVACYQA